MAIPSPTESKPWAERISRSGYFFGALLLHLIVFVLVATCVIFPKINPPADPIITTYLQPSAKPVQQQPPDQPTVDLSLQTSSNPSTPIVARADTHPITTVPVPIIDPKAPTLGTPIDPLPHVDVKPDTISPERLKNILDFIKASTGRTPDDIRQSNNDPKNTKAKFVVYLASYADGDWGCNVITADGKLVAGSLPNFLAKIGEWSHGRITAEVMPTPLNIGGPDLMDKKPPFIFFTGHKDFILTEKEVENLRDYVGMGGLIWGDNAEPGRGSRFDVAFRREMKRVVPDKNKNFEPVAMTDAIFTKSWYPITQIPQGMNYFAEPPEHLDIDGELAILYTPNDYSDMFTMRILPGDTEIGPTQVGRNSTSPLVTNGLFLDHSDVFFRNYKLPSCLACDQFGMNVIGYMLVRFDDKLLLTP